MSVKIVPGASQQPSTAHSTPASHEPSAWSTARERSLAGTAVDPHLPPARNAEASGLRHRAVPRNADLKAQAQSSANLSPSRPVAAADPLLELQGDHAIPEQAYQRAEMPTDPAARRAVLENAALANYVYQRDTSKLPDGWATSTNLSSALRASLDLPFETPHGVAEAPSVNAAAHEVSDLAPHVENAFGTIVDKKTGLAASVLVNQDSKEIVLTLGGTTGGSKVGDTADERALKNKGETLKQWVVNLMAAGGRLPESYKQADTMLSTLQDLTKQDPWRGFKVRVVGHSKGGGEALYAAMKQKEPVKADLFGPAALHRSLIARLPKARIKDAAKLVNVYYVRGDPVVEMMRRWVPGICSLGTERSIAPDRLKGSSARHCHEEFFSHFFSNLSVKPPKA